MAKFKTILKARYLRKEETKAEKILWQKLRNNKLGIKFRRQHPLDMFIIDFYAPLIKLTIELDGSIHNLKENKEYDKERRLYLESKNIKVLRFWNSEIEKDLEKVLQKIKAEIKTLFGTQERVG
jgi:5-methyltetrahydrofolate--homocysteine methyltransferase/ATP-dependent helicase HrpA